LWIVLGVIVAVNVLILVVNEIAPGPSGKRSSSLATAPDGFAAWAELARRNGIEVVPLRADLHDAQLPAGATVVALDVPRLAREDAEVLRDFAAAGGHVVAGGRRPDRWLDVLDESLVWRDDGPRTAVAVADVPATDGVRAIRGAGEGRWSGAPFAGGSAPSGGSAPPGAAAPPGGSAPSGGSAPPGSGPPGGSAPSAGAAPASSARRQTVLADGDHAVLVTRGGFSFLADASPLQNERLAEADNAALALNLAGAGPLIFAEAPHGYGESTGLGALPGAAKGALILLLAATLLLMLARGRRFGPPEPEARELPPPRAQYVDALGAALARTSDHEEAMKPVREALGGAEDVPPIRDHAGAVELARRLKGPR
jgi:hypothetical protein